MVKKIKVETQTKHNVKLEILKLVDKLINNHIHRIQFQQEKLKPIQLQPLKNNNKAITGEFKLNIIPFT